MIIPDDIHTATWETIATNCPWREPAAFLYRCKGTKDLCDKEDKCAVMYHIHVVASMFNKEMSKVVDK